jgi:enoyl-CoA hydratase/carnithine racemase
MNQENDLLFDVSDGIATITMNRPHRKNALSVYVSNRLVELWQEIDRDPDIRVAVITSTDCGIFCAGMDLKETAEIQEKEGVNILDKLTDPFMNRMRKVKKPIIAAMTGGFTAGGMVISLNSDLRVALAGTKCGVREAKVGRGSPWAVPLLWQMPQPILMEMVLTAEWFEVERMQQMGFINYVEDTPDAVRARARQLAKSITVNAPLSVKAGKASILAGMSHGCDLGLEVASLLHKEAYESDDAIEGPKAFAEKRAPNWTGQY